MAEHDGPDDGAGDAARRAQSRRTSLKESGKDAAGGNEKMDQVAAAEQRGAAWREGTMEGKVMI